MSEFKLNYTGQEIQNKLDKIDEINTLQSRIDALTSLSEGSTTGDAELADIRVKVDGTIAPTAGTAVREQISELKGDLVELSKSVDNSVYTDFVDGEGWNGTVGEKIKTSLYELVSKMSLVNARVGDKFRLLTYGVGGWAKRYYELDENLIVLYAHTGSGRLDGVIEISNESTRYLAINKGNAFNFEFYRYNEDIAQNKADIAQNKTDLNNYAKSNFRYVPTTENNKFCSWDTGKIQSYDGKSVCSRIPVTELENVEIYSNNNIASICFFNDETFVSGKGPSSKSFSIPANCNNVIISFDGLDTNIVLVYRSKIDDYIVNTQVLPTYEFSVKTTKGFMRWDNGKVYINNDYMMTQPFIVEPGREYCVDGAVTIAACFLNGNAFVSGIALNGVDRFTIPEGCNRCVVDFSILTNLPNILIRDPMFVNKSPCYGKSLGCLGDSITQGVGNNNHSWVDAMKGMCGFKTVYNYGVSGNTIEQMYDRIDAMERTLDYITILGGTNNALWSNSQSIANFKASFDLLVSSIIEKYPTSKVLGIIPPKYNYSSGDVTRNWNVATSPNNLKLIDFVNAEIEIYSKYSVPIVNLFSRCNIQPDINAQKTGLMPDGVHPNQKGYFDFIAPKIAEALKSI